MSSTQSDLQSALAYAETQREDDLADLFRLIRQPSISAQNIGVQECAVLEEELLNDAGLATRRLETSGHPMIYGEWLGAPGKPTILFYGHYDVQPADPLNLWKSDPFEPEIRDGRIYARGVADNKAQELFAEDASASRSPAVSSSVNPCFSSHFA